MSSRRDYERMRSRSPTYSGSGSSRGSHTWPSEERRRGAERRRRSRSPGRGRGNQDYPSRRGGTQSSSSRSTLEDLPDEVKVPGSGVPVKVKVLTPRNPNGKSIMVKTNHFRVQSLPGNGAQIFQYSLRFKVPPTSQRRGTDAATKQQIARTFILLQSNNLFGPEFVFDNVSLGYSVKELMPVESINATIIDLPGHTPEKHNQIEVSVRSDGPLDLQPLMDWMADGNVGLEPDDPVVARLVKALNTVFRDFPANKRRWTSFKTTFFHRNPELTFKLQSTGGVLEAIRGVHQAISIGFGPNLCVNVDNACSAFWTPGLSWLQVAATLAGIRPNDPITDQEEMKRFRSGLERLKGCFFTTPHNRREQEAESKFPRALFEDRKIRMDGISIGSAASTTFSRINDTTAEETEVSIAQYFRERYGINLKYPQLPMVRTQRDELFPTELCIMPEGERFKDKLYGQKTADFIKVCTAPANVRREQIHEHLKRLQWHKQFVLSEMGISVETSMLSVRAKQLQVPIPQYGGGSDTQPPRGGFWNLKGKRLQDPSSFASWGVLYFPADRKAGQEELRRFCKSFADCCAQYGLSPPRDAPAMLLGNPQGNIESIIKDLVGKVRGVFNCEKPDLLLVFLHQDMAVASDKSNDGKEEDIGLNLYKTIKNVCEIEGIPTQVMIIEKSVWSQKGQMQYIANVVLKVNAKLGGFNHMVPDDKLFARPIMMIGADISHPSPRELRQVPPPVSLAAVVGSYDRFCAKFTAVTTAIPTTQHILTDLRPIVEELLTRFKARVGRYPEKIIYWRDGVADSEVTALKEVELSAFEEIRKERKIQFQLTAINCVKKHKTRFFPDENGQSDRLGNVLPGTVVENSTLNNDFYTVTQAALQGTCVPTHYVSVVDENNLSPEDLQRLVVSSCFSYQRATRSVKVVPAVYYADQCAERAKMHMRSEEGRTRLREVASNLAFSMYWQ